eukprot:518087-Pyramimonas_sp.AAC.1
MRTNLRAEMLLVVYQEITRDLKSCVPRSTRLNGCVVQKSTACAGSIFDGSADAECFHPSAEAEVNGPLGP